jgi:non-homologous end joining protein Ku
MNIVPLLSIVKKKQHQKKNVVETEEAEAAPQPIDILQALKRSLAQTTKASSSSRRTAYRMTAKKAA